MDNWQIKLFTLGNNDAAEREINSFLIKIPSEKILDIKFSSAGNSVEKSVMIIYKN